MARSANFRVMQRQVTLRPSEARKLRKVAIKALAILKKGRVRSDEYLVAYWILFESEKSRKYIASLPEVPNPRPPPPQPEPEIMAG